MEAKFPNICDSFNVDEYISRFDHPESVEILINTVPDAVLLNNHKSLNDIAITSVLCLPIEFRF